MHGFAPTKNAKKKNNVKLTNKLQKKTPKNHEWTFAFQMHSYHPFIVYVSLFCFFEFTGHKQKETKTKQKTTQKTRQKVQSKKKKKKSDKLKVKKKSIWVFWEHNNTHSVCFMVWHVLYFFVSKKKKTKKQTQKHTNQEMQSWMVLHKKGHPKTTNKNKTF